MPGARTHDMITVATGVLLAPPAFIALAASAPETALAHTFLLVGAHLLSGIMFSPDLDLDSSIDNRWGIFYWIWRPYTWLVPHRHFWSHGLILPPLLRLLYFYLVVMGLLIGTAWIFGQIGIVLPDYHIRLTDTLLRLFREYPRAVLVFLIGFVTGGAAHTFADWLVTGGKRYLNRLGFRITIDYTGHDRYVPRHQRRARAPW